ncbi:MAG: T9SS type A sorting domain-containing protein, partial [Bacteroidota bacterium]
MKKFLIISALITFSAFSMKAQNCQAGFSFVSDTNTTNVQFYDSSFVLSGNITSWFWDFGDGTSSTLQNPQHTFPGYQSSVCLTITTDNPCTSTYCDSIYIYNPNPCVGFHSFFNNITYTTDSSSCDGAIDINVYGGTPPYVYYWAGPSGYSAATQDIQSLCIGYYFFSVTDSNGCTISNNIIIGFDSTGYIYPCHMLTPVLVYESYTGASDGSINITMAGGTPPYSYYWSNGVTTEDLYNIGYGQYTVSVMDTLSCNLTATFFIDTVGNGNFYLDTLTSNVVDTCLSFIYDSVYIYSYFWINSNTVSITWAFIGSGQTGYVTAEYLVNQYGYNYAMLTINCGTKLIEIFTDVIYIYDPTTGVLSNKRLSDILIYPNPFSDRFFISVNSITESTFKIMAIDINGKQILRVNKDVLKGENIFEFNFSNTDNGIYFI